MVVAIISLIVGIRLKEETHSFIDPLIQQPQLQKENREREGNDFHLAEMANVTRRKDATSSYMFICRQNGSNGTEAFNILMMPPKTDSILRADNLITMSSTKYISLVAVHRFILHHLATLAQSPHLF